MKTDKQKRPAPDKANREPSEPVGTGETANPSGEIETGAARGAQGETGAAKCARPVFVDEIDAAEMPNFEPSPKMFVCACAFLWDETRNAYFNGDNDLLARDGIADALDYLTMPDNAGIDTAARRVFFDEWAANTAARLENFKTQDRDAARGVFWRAFDESFPPSENVLMLREGYLRWPYTGRLLRALQKFEADTKDAADIAARQEYLDTMADRFIYAGLTDKPNPETIRAEWLNNQVGMFGQEMVKWLSVAALPDYAETLAEINKAIADNFGVFPVPYAVEKSPCGTCKYVQLVREELPKLVYIARSMRRGKTQTANGGARVAVDCKPDAAHGAANRDAANPSGIVNLSGNVVINSPEPVQVNAPAPKQKPAGHSGGISQSKFAALLIHYGGKCDGMRYTKRQIQTWDKNPEKRPTAHGEKYSPNLRLDSMRARTWANDFNRERENAYKARKYRV